jgi:hypothetical protein
LQERGLQGVKMLRRGQPFDGGDAPACSFLDADAARLHGFTVEMHRAGATLAVAAAVLGASQPQLLA